MPLVLAHYAYASLIVMKNKLKNIKRLARKRAAAADDNDTEAHALDAEVEAEANTVDAVAEEESNKRKAPASEKGQSCQKKARCNLLHLPPYVHTAAAALREPLMVQFCSPGRSLCISRI